MAVFDVRIWLARVRKSKLSTRVTALFVAAFILPWVVYAWLTVTERAGQMQRTEHNLAALAAAYAEHAAALMRLGVAVPIDGTVSNNSTERGEAEMTAFRVALNAVERDLFWVSIHRFSTELSTLWVGVGGIKDTISCVLLLISGDPRDL